MRRKERKVIVTFRTTSQAMALEKCCKEYEMPGRLIPVPREITAGCGLAWAAPAEEKQGLVEFLESQKLQYEAVTELFL